MLVTDLNTKYLRAECNTYLDFAGKELVAEYHAVFWPFLAASFLEGIGVEHFQANVAVTCQLLSAPEAGFANALDRRRLNSATRGNSDTWAHSRRTALTKVEHTMEVAPSVVSARADIYEASVPEDHQGGKVNGNARIVATQEALVDKGLEAKPGSLGSGRKLSSNQLLKVTLIAHIMKDAGVTENDLVAIFGGDSGSDMFAKALSEMSQLAGMQAKGFDFAINSPLSVSSSPVLVEEMPFSSRFRINVTRTIRKEIETVKSSATFFVTILLSGLTQAVCFCIVYRRLRRRCYKPTQGSVSIPVGRNTVNATWTCARNANTADKKRHLVWDMDLDDLKPVLASQARRTMLMGTEIPSDDTTPSDTRVSETLGGTIDFDIGVESFFPDEKDVEYFSQHHQLWLRGQVRVSGVRRDAWETQLSYNVSLSVGQKTQLRGDVPVFLMRAPIQRGELVEVCSSSSSWFPAVVNRVLRRGLGLGLYFDVEIEDPCSGKSVQAIQVPSTYIRRRFPIGTSVSAYMRDLNIWRSGIVTASNRGVTGGPVPESAPSPEIGPSLSHIRVDRQNIAPWISTRNEVEVKFDDGGLMYVDTHMLMNRMGHQRLSEHNMGACYV